MGEVGSHGPAFHREVGVHARECGIEALYALGTLTADAVAAFGAGAAHFESIEALLAALRPQLSAKLTVLVKGSRFMRMERIVNELAARQPAGVH
jgi:UDP-N-acetylmuramoyl-tripeptide--D-alanyl-D-alanine ligase